jgi:hypothetical protein
MRQPSRCIVVEQNPSILEDARRRQTLQPKVNMEMVVIKAHLTSVCRVFTMQKNLEINGYTARLFSVRKVAYSIESSM